MIRSMPAMLFVLCALSAARTTSAESQEVDHDGAAANRPAVLGHGVGLFRVGQLVAQDDFPDLENWTVQLQQKTGFEPAHVEARNNTLDCMVPGRGCTVWFRRKLPSRIAITYDVICPTHQPAIEGVTPRDINSFWMASDPFDADQGLFDREKYTGVFTSYNKMHAYYASTGGRRNQTTRMRRYPREVNREPTDHVALSDKDKKPGYLITPDRIMTVQLVAFDDVIQYIVDGKLVYQMARGDTVTIESANGETQHESYRVDKLPIYNEGYFGFRMVGTHHIYSKFRVYSLESVKPARRRPIVKVLNLNELREAITKDNQQIVLKPGEYEVADRRGFRFSGSNNDVNLNGVYIKVPMETVSGKTLFRLTGNKITLRGGTLEDTYPDGSTEVTDFGAYNQKRKLGGMNEITVSGDDNRIVGITMTVRGSFPYGYGNMFGIGRGNVVGLKKHCGIQITGDRAIIDGANIKMEAFGHVIYVQGGDQTTIKNTVIEGTLRPSNDCYNETDAGDLAKRFDYQLQWPEEVKGLPIPRDHMLNCTEDGIRAYKGAGDMIVDNCVVKKCRGGIKLYMAKSAKVTNCQVLDCVVQGYSVPRRGIIESSSGNAAYGPLLYVHFDGHSDQRIDLEVLSAPHSLGDHPLAAIRGRNHQIRFTQADTTAGETEPARPIIVGYPMRFDFLSVDYPDVPKGYEEKFAEHAPSNYTATGISIQNETPHPVVFGKLATHNTVTSMGPVRDDGTSNTLTAASARQAR